MIRDPRIVESSGLAMSVRHPGVLWTHNDSGHPAQLFAVRADGRTAATIRVLGVPATDWEAIAAYRDRTGRPMLAVADTGDNGATRSSVSIVVLPEPALRDATVRPERVIRLRYPSGAVDAEALLVDPDGRRAFVVSKGFGGTVYEVPGAVWTAAPGARSAGTATFVKRAGVPLVLVTDAVMGPGGHPLVRTYRELAVLPPIDDGVTGGSVEPLTVVRLPGQQQGESVALKDARTLLIGSEGPRQAVLRVPLPPEALEVLATTTTSPTSLAPSAASATSRGTPSVPGAAGDRGVSRLLPVLGGAVGAAVGAVVVLGALARRRRIGPHRSSPVPPASPVSR